MQKKDVLKNEYGSVEVEATVILPLVILSVFLLIFTAEMLLERALLQSSLENALTYYCSTLTDDYISVEKNVSYGAYDSEGGRRGKGNHFGPISGPLLAYRGLFGNANKVSESDFKKFFFSTGSFLFKNKIEVTFSYKNNIIYEEMSATAVQTVEFPIDFSVFGVKKDMKLAASSKVVVVDNENLVDNIDLAVHWINKTKLGDLLKNVGAKVGEIYDKIRSVLGAE